MSTYSNNFKKCVCLAAKAAEGEEQEEEELEEEEEEHWANQQLHHTVCAVVGLSGRHAPSDIANFAMSFGFREGVPHLTSQML